MSSLAAIHNMVDLVGETDHDAEARVRRDTPQGCTGGERGTTISLCTHKQNKRHV